MLGRKPRISVSDYSGKCFTVLREHLERLGE